MKEQGPTLTDAWIAERWPDQDPAEVRRRFDALMEKLGETPWRGVPRWPEAMQPVLAWAAMLPWQRAEILAAALADVPEHLRDYLWVAEKPMFGEQRVKFQSVCGDNGHGMGRQAVATTPYVKGYNLAPWIAAASPGNIAALLAERTALREAVGQHDARVTDLLEANNREVERRRAAEQRLSCLTEAAENLRQCQRAYLDDRGNEELGRQVGLAAACLDAALNPENPA